MSSALDATHPSAHAVADVRRPSATLRVLARELRAHRKTLLAWGLPVAGLLALTASMQPSIAGDGGLLAAKLAVMPEAVRRAFGMTLVDFSQPASYLATNFIYVTLTGSLFAGLLGATLVSKEEALHTAELLLAQPVSRSEVLLGKALALVGLVVAFHVLLAVAVLGTFAAVVTVDLQAGLVAQLFVSNTALALCFGGAGMLAATFVKEARGAGGAALGIVFGTYLVGITSGIAPKAENLRYLSPYKLVEPAGIVSAGGLDAGRTALLVALGITCAAIAFVRWGRKDIHA